MKLQRVEFIAAVKIPGMADLQHWAMADREGLPWCVMELADTWVRVQLTPEWTAKLQQGPQAPVLVPLSNIKAMIPVDEQPAVSDAAKFAEAITTNPDFLATVERLGPPAPKPRGRPRKVQEPPTQ